MLTLTGDQSNTADQPDAAKRQYFSNSESITVEAARVGTTSGTVSNVAFSVGTRTVPVQVLNGGQGYVRYEATFDGANKLPEGEWQVSVSATATRNGNSASSQATMVGTLVVDRTPPKTSFTTPLRTSVTDDKDIVYLNANDENGEQGNIQLRKRGANVYARAAFTPAFDIVDATGLSRDATRLAAQAALHSQTFSLVPHPSYAQAGDSVTLTGFANLPESLELGQDGTPNKYSGRYTVSIKVQDRAGNALTGDSFSRSAFSDQFKMWVDVTPPKAYPATQLYCLEYPLVQEIGEPYEFEPITVTTQGVLYTALSNARYFAGSFDACEAWQNDPTEANRVFRAYRGTESLPDSLDAAKKADCSPWLFRTPLQIVSVPRNAFFRRGRALV